MTAAPRRRGTRSQPRQRGASVLLVIAVMMVLGSLSVYAVGLVSGVNSEFGTAFNSLSAEQAALSGLDWARYRMLQNNVACTASQNVAMPAGPLAPYTVTVRCTTGGADVAGPPASLVQYRLTVTACNVPTGGACPNTSVNPGVNYVERQVTALIER